VKAQRLSNTSPDITNISNSSIISDSSFTTEDIQTEDIQFTPSDGVPEIENHVTVATSRIVDLAGISQIKKNSCSCQNFAANLNSALFDEDAQKNQM